MPDAKTCTGCGQQKPLTEFARDRRARDGYHQQCLECKRSARKQWREAHPDIAKEQFRAWSAANYDKHLARNRRWQAGNRDKMHHSMLMSRYRITLEDYQCMFEAQGGKCKICGEAGSLVVDHKHDASRKVRGLLCVRCNSGIGFFRENVDVMLSAIGYLTLEEAFDREKYTVSMRVSRNEDGV